MTSTGWAAVVIASIVIAGGAWWYTSTSQPPADVTVNVEQQDTTPAETGSNVPGGNGAVVEVGAGVSTGAPMAATVTYSDSGFSPATVTIKKGGTVTWVNQSSGNMWVATARHPTHTVYNGTALSEHCGTAQESAAFDQCRGESGNWSFTFTKAGSWAYHDHINASRFGRVEVVE